MIKITNTAKLFITFLLSTLFILQFEACKKEPGNIGSRVDSTSSNSYGTLIYGYGPSYSGMGRLYALNLDSGNILWNVPAFVYDNNSMLYENGIIYTCSMYGATAVDAKTGIVKWSNNVASLNHDQSNTKHANHPVVKDSFLYFTTFYTDNENVGLNCLNKNTGALVWKKNLTLGISPAWVYSTPAILGDKIIAISHGSNREYNAIHCLNRFTGVELWKDISATGTVWDNPIVLDSTSALFGSTESALWKVNTKDSTVSLFSYVGSIGRMSYNMNFLLRDKSLYIGTDNGIAILNANTGDITNSLKDTVDNYLISSNSIYLQKSFGKIQAGNLNTFQKKWLWKSRLRTYADTVKFDLFVTIINSFLVSDDKIVCYYESYVNTPAISVNSFYVLDAITGKLLKEFKFPTVPPNFAGRNLMLLRDNKAYYSLSNHVR